MSETKLEEFQASLKAHELRMKERNSKIVSKQALPAKSLRKSKKNPKKTTKLKKNGRRSGIEEMVHARIQDFMVRIARMMQLRV